MAALNVVLSERENALIADLVGSGQFHDATEVVQEGLRLVEAERMDDARKLLALRDAVQLGIDDIGQGRSVALRGAEEISAYIHSLGERAAERVATSKGN